MKITLYSMRSCTLNQCRDLRIRSGTQDGRTWELQQQHEQEHSGYAEGDLTIFGEDNSKLTPNCSSQVWSEQKICRDGASRIEIKIPNVVDTCTRDRRYMKLVLC